MSAAKHTPGPWRFSARLSGSENHRGYFVWPVARQYAIAEAIPMDEDGNEGGANARLIAAAPELLEALQLVRMSNGWRYMATETHEVIDAAIAKATGEPV